MTWMQGLSEPLPRALGFERNNHCSLFSRNEDVEATFYIIIKVFIVSLGDLMLIVLSHPHLPNLRTVPKPAEEN